MEYQEALRRLLSLTDLERMAGQPAGRPRHDLGRFRRLLSLLGEPHKAVPAVHITGTKGKGSTAAMVASVLGAAGLRPGLYTSPHLHTFRERIRLGLEPVGEEEFACLVGSIWPAVDQVADEGAYGRVTTFEALTAMAFSHFRASGCGLQVVEVGLGGTLDATNVLEAPPVCVITPISLDHTDVLGDTVEKIARDKAGIIKPGATVICAPQPPEARRVIGEAAKEKGAELLWVAEAYRWERGPWDLTGQRARFLSPRHEYTVWLPLLGRHQLENAAGALAVADALRARGWPIPKAALERGLQEVHWPGRLEVLSRSPLVVVDGAHNPHSFQRLREALGEYLRYGALHLILGLTYGHDGAGILREVRALGPQRLLLTRSRHPRSVPPEVLVTWAAEAGLDGEICPDVPAALEKALAGAGPGDLVLAAGSLFTVAEVREVVKGIPGEVYPEFQPHILPVRTV